MRRRTPADPPHPQDDWLARASAERQARDARFRQHKAALSQQEARADAWRPQIEGLTRPAHRALRGTRDRH